MNYLSRNTKRKVKTPPIRVAAVGLRPFLVNDMTVLSTTKGSNFKWFAQSLCGFLGLRPYAQTQMRFSDPGFNGGQSFFTSSRESPAMAQGDWLLFYIRGGRAVQNIRLDRTHLIGLQQVFERGHAKLLASAAQHDGLELKVGCSTGVAEVRNTRA